MINNQFIIAKRYARAFLNAFVINSEDIEKLSTAIDFLKQHPEIFIFLKIPLIDPRTKSNALKESITQRFDLPAPLQVMVELLIAKKRSELILQVFEQIKNYYQQMHHIAQFSIASSVELDESQKKNLEHYLADATGDTIDARYSIDKKLIAGIRVQSDEYKWEDSIAHQLKKIHANLMG